MYYKVRHYQYKNRIGNLKAEAVGVVSGEKHFPIFPGNMIFKPLTKSKPFSTPLYAYAEVFWSTIINILCLRPGMNWPSVKGMRQ